MTEPVTRDEFEQLTKATDELAELWETMIEDAKEGKFDELDPELAKYMYEDDTFGCCIKHPLYFSMIHSPIMNRLANKALEQKTKALRKARRDCEWGVYVALHERAYRVEALMQIADKLSDADYWQLVGETWIDSENITETQKDWRYLLMSKRPLRENIMDEEEREHLAGMPDIIPVFRGFNLDSHEKGWSYTTDLARAIWFSKRYDTDGSSRITWGHVEKKNVIAYFSGRGEEEIVVAPEHVKVDSIKRAPNTPAGYGSGETKGYDH